MKKIQRKLMGGAFALGLAMIIPASFSLISKNHDNSLPVSVAYEENKPIIVIDAGHGE